MYKWVNSVSLVNWSFDEVVMGHVAMKMSYCKAFLANEGIKISPEEFK